MENDCLTKAECAALRGMAIIAIMLHNYCHWLSFSIKENEYVFHGYYNHYLWNHVLHLNSHVLFDLFSFFGHYGVPVFLFISGYGLVMKYERSHVPVPAIRFIGYHYLKLLRLMTVGFIIYIVVDCLLQGIFRFTIMRIIGQLTMLINLSSDPDGNIKPGPYWYFGLMLQLYAVYRLLFYRRHSIVVALLVVLCWMVQALCLPAGDMLNWLRYNCIGAMLPFGVGILYARYGRRMGVISNMIVLCVSVVAVCLFGSRFQSWLWVPLFVVTSAVTFVRLMPAVACKPLLWIGGFSSSIFVIHPIIRPIIINIAGNDINPYVSLAIYVIVSVVVSYFYSIMLRYIPKPKLRQ